jgi:hypothetical protein
MWFDLCWRSRCERLEALAGHELGAAALGEVAGEAPSPFAYRRYAGYDAGADRYQPTQKDYER